MERQTFERSNTATLRAAEFHTVASTLLLPIINKAVGCSAASYTVFCKHATVMRRIDLRINLLIPYGVNEATLSLCQGDRLNGHV